MHGSAMAAKTSVHQGYNMACSVSTNKCTYKILEWYRLIVISLALCTVYIDGNAITLILHNLPVLGVWGYVKAGLWTLHPVMDNIYIVE